MEATLKQLGESSGHNLPDVSVIIRTTNRRTLARAIDSVAAQTYQPIEIVLVEVVPGCLDGARVARDGLSHQIVPASQPRPRSQAANAGLAAASGSALAFLDDDDWLYPHHIETLVGALIHSNCGVAYGDIDVVDVGAKGDERIVATYREAYDGMRLLCHNYIPIHACVFNRDLLAHGAGFDESLDLCEDWDFWIQLSRITQFRHIPGTVGAYRTPHGSPLYGLCGRAAAESRLRIHAKWVRALDHGMVSSLLDYAASNTCERLGAVAEATRYRGEATQLKVDVARLEAEAAQLQADVARLAAEVARLRQKAQRSIAVPKRLHTPVSELKRVWNRISG